MFKSLHPCKKPRVQGFKWARGCVASAATRVDWTLHKILPPTT